MRIVAFMAARNERPYLRNCLSHLIANGIDYFIVDNDSDDGTAELLREEPFARHLAGYETYPFDGVFDWEGLLGALEAAWTEFDADWTILHAPDEVMHSYRPDETLHDAIRRIDAAGYDVVDFDEFVFLPIDHDYVVDADGPQPMQWYFLRRLRKPKQMRARKKTLKGTLRNTGGHVFEGQPYKLAPETFALRHYMFRSQDHAFAKYPHRRFRADEVARGWHRDRTDKAREQFAFPPVRLLDYLPDPSSRAFQRDDPRPRYYWMSDQEPVEVVGYGPPAVVAGTRFNVRADGKSVLWLKAARPLPAGTRVRLGGQDLRTTVEGDLATAVVPPRMTRRPGELTLQLVSRDGWSRSDLLRLKVIPETPLPG